VVNSQRAYGGAVEGRASDVIMRTKRTQIVIARRPAGALHRPQRAAAAHGQGRIPSLPVTSVEECRSKE
jgi:hypothetical protein